MTAEALDNLDVRLAETSEEIAAAQALRYHAFYEEAGIEPCRELKDSQRDTDRFDGVCDHLIVVDTTVPDDEQVVGNYRLLRRSVAMQSTGFYSQGEFELGPLLEHPREVLELGRSCIDARYRPRGVMNLLWRGIADYVIAHDVDVMFGCGSFPETDPQAFAHALSYLHHFHLAAESLRPRAHRERHVNMNLVPAEEVNIERALNELPPLMKAYLRLGTKVGDGAVVDHELGLLDACVVVETSAISDRYFRRYLEQSRVRRRAA